MQEPDKSPRAAADDTPARERAPQQRGLKEQPTRLQVELRQRLRHFFREHAAPPPSAES